MSHKHMIHEYCSQQIHVATCISSQINIVNVQYQVLPICSTATVAKENAVCLCSRQVTKIDLHQAKQVFDQLIQSTRQTIQISQYCVRSH